MSSKPNEKISLEHMKELYSWDLFVLGNKITSTPTQITSITQTKYWDDNFVRFVHEFGFPNYPLCDIMFRPYKEIYIDSIHEREWLDIGHRYSTKSVVSILVDSGDVYWRDPHIFFCSSILNFVYWSTIEIAFYQKHHQDGMSVIDDVYKNLMNDFALCDPKAIEMNGILFNKIEDIIGMF